MHTKVDNKLDYRVNWGSITNSLFNYELGLHIWLYNKKVQKDRADALWYTWTFSHWCKGNNKYCDFHECVDKDSIICSNCGTSLSNFNLFRLKLGA